jgi:multimeric flavodoxin WrbA
MELREDNVNIVSVFGSPRKKGNTAAVLNWVEEELRSQGHEVDRINIKDHAINGCIECYVCQTKPDEPGCPQKDDLLDVMSRVIDADVVIYASPMFCWSWTAQIKPFIDRHFCLVTDSGSPQWKSLIEGKKAALVMTLGGPMEGNGDLLVKQFEGLVEYGKAVVAGMLTVPFCSTPEAIGGDVKEQAVTFAQELAG